MMSISMESEATVTESMTREFPRFGACTFGPDDVFEFPWGLPGFPNLRHWLALSVETQSSFVWLQSLDDVNVALPTADPNFLFEDYDPKLPAYVVAALEIASASDFTLLCVVVVTEDAQEMTMNLFAPIVVNLLTRKGRQIMLENSGFSIRQPIPRKTEAQQAHPAG
jgi:flagellar assembly factor FliW